MNIKIINKAIFSFFLLASLIFLSGCSGQKVQTVTEETEANQILDVLRQHGINAYKQETGEGEKKTFDIMISGGDEEYGSAIQLMEDHCLPQPMPPKVEATGIVSSMEVEKAQELRRIKINIESQLRNIPGTTCVTVTVVPLEDKSLSLDPYKSTATVLVKHKNEKYDLNTSQIARMVAGGVPGLSADNVTVSLTREPLRPLPDFNRGRNLRRILYVSGVGLTTILLFVGFVLYLRKRKGESVKELTDGDVDQEQDLLDVDIDDDSDLLESGDLDDADIDNDFDTNEER